MLQIELGRKSDEPLEIALLDLGIESSFIERVQIVSDVHELGPVEDLLELA